MKNNEFRERLCYASPNMKVIEVNASRVICQSGDIDDFNVRDDDSENWS